MWQEVKSSDNTVDLALFEVQLKRMILVVQAALIRWVVIRVNGKYFESDELSAWPSL